VLALRPFLAYRWHSFLAFPKPNAAFKSVSSFVLLIGDLFGLTPKRERTESGEMVFPVFVPILERITFSVCQPLLRVYSFSPVPSFQIQRSGGISLSLNDSEHGRNR